MIKQLKKENLDIEHRLLDLELLASTVNVKVIHHKKGKYLDFANFSLEKEENVLNLVHFLETQLPIITICSLEMKELMVASLVKHLKLFSYDIFINGQKSGIHIYYNLLDFIFTPRSPLVIPKGAKIDDHKLYSIIQDNPKKILKALDKQDLIFIRYVENEVFDNPDKATDIDKYISNPDEYVKRMKVLMMRKIGK